MAAHSVGGQELLDHGPAVGVEMGRDTSPVAGLHAGVDVGSASGLGSMAVLMLSLPFSLSANMAPARQARHSESCP